jgi:drug/metabolite transporter (DMT)-like permease
MVFGIALIVAGILIAVYPQLLSLIAASLLIFSGLFFVFLSYSYKKIARQSEDPMMKFFIRF